MEYRPGVCLFCGYDTAEPHDFDLHRLVAVRCQACGARGPLVVVQDSESRGAATVLAVELWNRAGRIEETEYVRQGSIKAANHWPLTDADKDEIDRIAAAIANTEEPATEPPTDPGGTSPGPTKARDASDELSVDPPQVSEAAGGGGGEEATPDTTKAPTVDTDAAARAGATAQGAEQPRPDPASNGDDRNGAAADRKKKSKPPADKHKDGEKTPPENNETYELRERVLAVKSAQGLTDRQIIDGIGIAVQTFYTFMKAGVSQRTRDKVRAWLEAAEKAELEAKVEVLPNRYDELNTGNPLPKLERPARCAETP